METMCLWICMLLFLVQYPTGFSLINNTSNHHACLEDERQLLLQLKQELSPVHPEHYYKTKYWNGSRDCCEWDGVKCDYFTGHVIALDLSYSFLSTDSTYLSGELKPNCSLFHLSHLRNLNLAYNRFDGSAIPSEFGRLNTLTHLNLSDAQFAGEIPTEFYDLSNLVFLDLHGDPLHRLQCDVKMLLGNMTRLRVLVLEYQNLSSSELHMNMSSFLTHLDLADTGLQGNLPATLFEKPNLQFLDLSGNEGLKGSLPKSLNWSNVHSIQVLDLRHTNISGRLPDSIGFMTNLNYMHLSGCRFSGPIPESIGNITTITRLDLSQNHLEGQLPDAFSGFQTLTYLDLSNNSLQGRLPSSLTNMSRLTYLDISSNALTGPFPSTAAGNGLKELYWMELSNNFIRGMIPPWLFSLPSLKRLSLSSNRLTGQIGKLNSKTLEYLDLSSNLLNHELQSFYNLTNIESLTISYNTVTTEHDGDDIVNVTTFPHLRSLGMSSCAINEFPNLLRSNPCLYSLDLSNNSIRGPIPSWFVSNASRTMSYLSLSANLLTYAGDLPWQGLRYLDLHSNSLLGEFPSSICNMSELEILDLSHNRLSGNIPECLTKFSDIQVLDLKRNEFHGKIPSAIGAMHQLANLGLNGNHLQGPLPPSLANCTSLQVVDLGNNVIQDTFPWWLHTFPMLRILILKSNNFHGSIATQAFTNNSFTSLQIFDLSDNNFTGVLPEQLFATLQAIKKQSPVSPYNRLYMGRDQYLYSVTLSVKGENVELTKVLTIFTTIDMSSNNFNGGIPVSLSNLTSLRLLNLSHNNIHGSIPPALGRMTNLEQLDLSNNQITGGIPQSLTSLTFLEALNLSHNHLVGPIPQGNQFSTFSNDSYAGNSGLCGAPLTRSCGDEKESPSAGEFEEDEGDGFLMGFTWKAVVMGYGCGIVLGFILGNVMISVKKPRWLERFVYAEAATILRRRKKRRRMVQGRR